MAEDYAMADIVTDGRVVMGVGRGYHTREVETFGAPTDRRREESRLLRGAVATSADLLQRAGVQVQGQVLRMPAGGGVPRLQAQGHHDGAAAEHLPVEIWMPIASGKTIDMMARYGLKGMITLNGEKISTTWCAPIMRRARSMPAKAARRGHDLGRRRLSRRQQGRSHAAA